MKTVDCDHEYGMIITSLHEKNVGLRTFIGRVSDVCGEIGWIDECFLNSINRQP